MLQDHNCNYHDTTPDWAINIDEHSNPNKSVKDKIPKSYQNLTIAHISDTHFDPKYLEGSNAVCNTPVCCRVDSVIFVFQVSKKKNVIQILKIYFLEYNK